MSPVPDPYHNDRGSNTEDLNNEIQGFIIAGPESSSEEEDHPAPDHVEYQLIPHGPELCEEDVIDYNSLSGLMSALNTNGPTEINSEATFTEENLPLSRITESAVDQACSEESTAIEGQSKKKDSDYAKEQVSLWNAERVSNQIEIDDKKEAEIKAVMARIVLPNSAIPQWAKELSDEQWNNHIVEQIKKDKQS